jgi:adenylosuccinate synthase
MRASLVIGSQWGDEGKGKIADFLSGKADYVVRFNGGNNAGHTVINQYGTFPLHLIPSGIFSKATACITNGTVLDLEVLAQEIALLETAGIKLTGRLLISPRCHVIMPYHKILDKLYENAKGKAATGTTGRGIGPVFADKVSYNGLRLFDLMDHKQFSEKLALQLTVKNKIITALSENDNLFPYKKHSGVKNKIMKTIAQKPLDQKEIETELYKHFAKIKPFIAEPYPVLAKAAKSNKTILFEGAQAVFLDNDWGTYPYVTAATILAGGINQGTGIPPQKLTEVIGVVKAYTTRVGAGPFPTELFNSNGEKLRKEGNEFGTTTGRPRRCGWFDAELIRFASELNGFTSIAITKLDVLDNFKEIKICTGYTHKNKPVRYYDGDAAFLENVKPEYITLPGWQQATKGITKFEKLPTNAQNYVKEIEKLVDVKASLIATGPKREEIIVR